MKLSFLILFFCYCTKLLMAQNIVPNASFEEVNICTEYIAPCAPCGWMAVAPEMIKMKSTMEQRKPSVVSRTSSAMGTPNRSPSTITTPMTTKDPNFQFPPAFWTKHEKIKLKVKKSKKWMKYINRFRDLKSFIHFLFLGFSSLHSPIVMLPLIHTILTPYSHMLIIPPSPMSLGQY